MGRVGFPACLEVVSLLSLFPYATVCARRYFAQDCNLGTGIRLGNIEGFPNSGAVREGLRVAFPLKSSARGGGAGSHPFENRSWGHPSLYAGKCADQRPEFFAVILFADAAFCSISLAERRWLARLAWLRSAHTRDSAVRCDGERMFASSCEASGSVCLCDGEANVSTRPGGRGLQPHRNGAKRCKASGSGARTALLPGEDGEGRAGLDRREGGRDTRSLRRISGAWADTQERSARRVGCREGRGEPALEAGQGYGAVLSAGRGRQGATAAAGYSAQADAGRVCAGKGCGEGKGGEAGRRIEG